MQTHRTSDPSTSAEAAAAIAPKVSTLQGKIIAALKSGDATASELMEKTGMIYNTTWRRLSELKAAGIVRNTEEKRQNPRGRNEVVVALAA